MEGYFLQWMDSGGIDGGLHPAVDGQQWMATSYSGWTVEVLMEGYILQWMDSGGY